MVQSKMYVNDSRCRRYQINLQLQILKVDKLINLIMNMSNYLNIQWHTFILYFKFRFLILPLAFITDMRNNTVLQPCWISD